MSAYPRESLLAMRRVLIWQNGEDFGDRSLSAQDEVQLEQGKIAFPPESREEMVR